MKYSIIVPVFNRPDEVDELLESLTHQSEKDFEVVIVEDGSQTPCEDVCKRYEHMMNIHYYFNLLQWMVFSVHTSTHQLMMAM